MDYKYAQNPDPYCYKGTAVLINILGIRDADLLAERERKITIARELELLKNPINGHFGFAHFKNIHKYIFQDLYDWAGEPRSARFLTERSMFTKGDTLFCLPERIDSYAAQIFNKLKQENRLRNMEHSHFCERLVYYASELNALHPFREGNGRTTRTFLGQLAYRAGYTINWGLANKDALLAADIQAFNKEYTSLINIYKQIITKKNAAA